MFEFNFLDEARKTEVTQDEEINEWKPAEEIHANDFESADELTNHPEIYTSKSGLRIKHVSSEAVLHELTLRDRDKNPTSALLSANESHSDLLAGVYEGGLKIWECTHDLITFIEEQCFDFRDKLCLDLGCGAGIVGVYALLHGSSVWFQDYNSEVVKHVTIRNVFMNMRKGLEKCRFFAGDWKSFEDTFGSHGAKFDYVFTSETIYNVGNYDKLHNLLKAVLKRDGEIYLAAKSYYFGVGGGLRQFEDLLRNKDVFKFSTCWKCEDGMMREILKITFK